MITRIGQVLGHSAAIYDLQYDTNYIYSASGDKFVARWDINSLEQDKFAIRFPVTPYSLATLPHKNELIVGLSDGAIHVFDLENKVELKHLQIHQSGIFCLRYIEELQWLFAADADGLVTIWKVDGYQLIVRLPLGCGKIRSVIYDSNLDSLLIGGQDGFIYAISCLTLNVSQLVFAHEGGVGTLLKISEHEILSGGKDGHLKKWDFNWNCIKSIPAHNYMIYDAKIFNEKYLITASRDKSIKIWDLSLMNVIQKLDLKEKGHRHSVNKIVIVNKNTFLSSSDDARILIWSILA